MSGKRIAVVAGVAVAAAVAVVGGYLWHARREAAAPSSELVVYGNVDIREVRLAFNGTEHVAQILVEEGAQVREGELLARLHTERLSLALEQARARTRAQAQVVARLQAGTRIEEIRVARARLAASQARAAAAEKRYRRTRDLAARRLGTEESADEAEGAYLAAQAEVRSDQASLDLALAGPRPEDVAAAKAELAALRAAEGVAAQTLADADLRSPAAGVIRERLVEPGDFVTPQTPVLTLARSDPVWIRAYLPEPLLGRVRAGTRAEIRTDSFPERTYPGWVGFISPTAEFTPKTVQTPELRTRLVYRMRVFACNPRGELRLGMPATVRLLAAAMPSAAGPAGGAAGACSE